MKNLSVSNLEMVYELPKGGSVHALSDVSFDLEAGRLLTLLGPSGCGKTTLLNIAAGFLAPTSGTVTLGGEPITGPGQERGMVFQQGALFEWQNVSQNVSFGPRMNRKKKSETAVIVEDLLATVGLRGFGDKAVYELSGGMQQRVALVRCLANDPDGHRVRKHHHHRRDWGVHGDGYAVPRGPPHPLAGQGMITIRGSSR